MKPITGLIHHDYRPPAGFEAVPPAVHKASTVIFPDVQALRSRDWRDKGGYTYGLHGTPTTFTLEARIATLEGGRHTILTPSGLSALSLVNLALLRPGHTVLLPDNVYGPSKELARGLLQEMGIHHRLYDPMDLTEVDALLKQGAELLWLEAPGSVSMEFPDLRALVRLGRQHGVCLALDNTWGAGLAFRPFRLGEGQGADLGEDLGVDISIHALTKFPSGGGDVLMGSVTTVDQGLHERLLLTHMRLGLGVGANDAEAVLRGLPSMALRYDAQDASARALAACLAQHPAVTRVLHPALPQSPGHAHWAAICTRAAGLFSFLIDERYTPADVDRFIDGLRLFKLGYSWAGPVSLVVPYRMETMRRETSALRGHLVRLSIGLEARDDLQADLMQALALLDRAPT